ncbi:MAG: DUF6377 domain-containing protein [Clostridium sp.]|nr:DUF6377 domain-containing protein [Prevotella sp.]MCM1428996.1 DUF6377 domain-containing protein [Clostridium sp.]MCM1475474.1 DUF6377 domain-containing protein [Muribaculaceae bacterium]
MKTNTLSLIIAIIAIIAASSCQEKHGNIPEQEINELKNTIKASAQYELEMDRKLDSIRRKINTAGNIEDKFHLNLQLSEDYRPINTDSALYYASVSYSLAMQGTPRMKLESEIATVNALSTAGIFTEAEHLFDTLSTETMDSTLRTQYWLAGRTLYSYMRSYVDGQDRYYKIYTDRYIAFDDSLLQHLPANDDFRQFVYGERLVSDGRYEQAQQTLQQLMKKVDPRSNLYGMAAYQLAEVYLHTGHTEKYAANLAIAAKTDVECCVHEGIALPTLANWLYEQGEMADAFLFINYALEDAMKGNARMRTVSIAKMVPLIDSAYRERINSSRDELMVYFILVSFLFILTGGLAAVLVRNIRRERESQKKLASLSKLQETYIGNFIRLCSEYADRLDSLSKTVSRKLTAGQSDELLKLVNSGKFADYRNERFNAMFDRAFIDLYPDFIEGINSLLRPEEQLIYNPEEPLSAELRIYAFVRLGVEESTRIAQILHYSVSTVYAYRNRMRNKAINRTTFDTDVMKIRN